MSDQAERVRRKAEAQALRDAAQAEHIRKFVDAAPPLTPDQRDRLAALLRPGGTYIPPVMPHVDEEAQRKRRVAWEQTKRADRLSRAVLACAICGCPKFAHPDGPGDHAWVPGRIDHVLDAVKAGKWDAEDDQERAR